MPADLLIEEGTTGMPDYPDDRYYEDPVPDDAIYEADTGRWTAPPRVHHPDGTTTLAHMATEAIEQARQWHERHQTVEEALAQPPEDTGAYVRDARMIPVPGARFDPVAGHITFVATEEAPGVPNTWDAQWEPVIRAERPAFGALAYDAITYGVAAPGRTRFIGGTLEDANRPETGQAPGVDIQGGHSALRNNTVQQSPEARKDYLLGLAAPDDVDFGGVFGCTDSPGAYAYLQRGG